MWTFYLVSLLISASLCCAVTKPKIKLMTDGNSSYFFCEAPPSRTDNCSAASTYFNESRWLRNGKNSTGYGTVRGRELHYSNQSPETEGSWQCVLMGSMGETGWSDPRDNFIAPNKMENQVVYAKLDSSFVEYNCQILVGPNTLNQRLQKVSLDVYTPCSSLQSRSALYNTTRRHLDPDNVLHGQNGVAFSLRNFTVLFNYSFYRHWEVDQSICVVCSITYYTDNQNRNTSPKTATTRIEPPPVSNPLTVEPTTPAPCEQGENDTTTTTSLFQLYFTRAKCSSEYKGGEVIRYLLTKHTCLESDTYSVAVSCEAGEDTAILSLTSTVGVTMETLSAALSDIAQVSTTLTLHTSMPTDTTPSSSEAKFSSSEATPCNCEPPSCVMHTLITVVAVLSVVSITFAASLIIYCSKWRNLKVNKVKQEQPYQDSTQQPCMVTYQRASDDGNMLTFVYTSGRQFRHEEGTADRMEEPCQPSSNSVAELATSSFGHTGIRPARMRQPRTVVCRGPRCPQQDDSMLPQCFPFVSTTLHPEEGNEPSELDSDVSPPLIQAESNSTHEQPHRSGHITVIPNLFSTYQTGSDIQELRREEVSLSLHEGGMPASETQGYSEGMQGDFV